MVFEFVKQQIKAFISIDDIINKYVPNTKKVQGRYKCPFNSAEDRYNFVVKGRSWRCFSCGCSGDEISLVMKLFDLSPQNAMKKIAEDFNLNIEPNDKDSDRLREELERRAKQREKDRLKAENLVRIQTQLYIYVVNKIRSLEVEIERTEPYVKGNYENYSRTLDCDKHLHSIAELRKYNEYADILGEFPRCDELDSHILTKEELHNEMLALVKQIYKGTVKI